MKGAAVPIGTDYHVRNAHDHDCGGVVNTYMTLFRYRALHGCVFLGMIGILIGSAYNAGGGVII